MGRIGIGRRLQIPAFTAIVSLIVPAVLGACVASNLRASSSGVDKAHAANASMRHIGEGARGAVGMVEEIAGAIREQGAATNNIAMQVERIAQMSEQSSAAAGQSAQSASEVDRLARDMQQIVGAYRL